MLLRLCNLQPLRIQITDGDVGVHLVLELENDLGGRRHAVFIHRDAHNAVARKLIARGNFALVHAHGIFHALHAGFRRGQENIPVGVDIFYAHQRNLRRGNIGRIAADKDDRLGRSAVFIHRHNHRFGAAERIIVRNHRKIGVDHGVARFAAQRSLRGDQVPRLVDIMDVYLRRRDGGRGRGGRFILIPEIHRRRGGRSKRIHEDFHLGRADQRIPGQQPLRIGKHHDALTGLAGDDAVARNRKPLRHGQIGNRNGRRRNRRFRRNGRRRFGRRFRGCFRRNGRRRFGRRDVLVIEHNLVLARALRGQQHILHILTQQEVALRQVERLRVHRRAALLQRRHRRRSDFVAVAHVTHRNLNRHDRRSRRLLRRRFGRRDVLVIEHNLVLACALRSQQHILHILAQQEVALRQVERLRVHRRAALLQRRHRRRSDFVAVAHVAHRNLNRHDRRSRRRFRRRFGRRVQRARRFRQGRKRRNVQVIARARFSIGGIGHDFHRRARGQRRARVRHKGQQTAR